MVGKSREITYNITEELGVISEKTKGWTLEFNLVSWNNGEPKYDIRQWSPDHEKIGKGITLTADELLTLKDFIDQEVARLDR